jgi:hypothetical protein
VAKSCAQLAAIATELSAAAADTAVLLAVCRVSNSKHVQPSSDCKQRWFILLLHAAEAAKLLKQRS